MENPVTPDGEHEILHLRKRMRHDGDIYEREVSYLSDHQIMHRFARNGDWGGGWSYWKLWEKLDDLYEVALIKEQKGWTVTWHIEYGPKLREFTRKVSFNGLGFEQGRLEIKCPRAESHAKKP